MKNIIKSSYVDSNNYYTIVAEIDVLDDNNTFIGTKTVSLPPVFITPVGWKDAVVSNTNADYENELITLHSNVWSDTITTEYKNNHQHLLDNLNISAFGFFTIEELDLILNNLLNE